MIIGNNQLLSKSTVMSPGSKIFMSLPGPLNSARLDADKELHLDGKVSIFGSSRWKPGDEHILMRGKPLTGNFDKVRFAGFSKSVKPVLIYRAKRLIVRINKKKKN
jgi:hypothetical protein